MIYLKHETREKPGEWNGHSYKTVVTLIPFDGLEKYVSDCADCGADVDVPEEVFFDCFESGKLHEAAFRCDSCVAGEGA